MKVSVTISYCTAVDSKERLRSGVRTGRITGHGLYGRVQSFISGTMTAMSIVGQGQGFPLIMAPGCLFSEVVFLFRPIINLLVES